MNRRLIKQELFFLLKKADIEEVYLFLCQHSPHLLLNPLFIALCNPSEQVRWRAVLAFGKIVPRMADNNPESARIVMRRFLWSLNDESGGIGWGAPEAMAEIMFHSSLLRQEYLHMLISYMQQDGEELFEDGNYLELPLLQRGLLWGIGRLCQGHRMEMLARQVEADLTPYLLSSDHQVAGLAIWCLGLLGVKAAKTKIAEFLYHPGEVNMFLNGAMHIRTMAELADEYMQRVHETGEIFSN